MILIYFHIYITINKIRMKGAGCMHITTIATIIRKIKELVTFKKKLLGKEETSLIVSIARQIYLNTNVMNLLLSNEGVLCDCDTCPGGVYIWSRYTENTPYKYDLTDDDTGILIFVDICDSCDNYLPDFQIAISDMGERIFFRFATKDKEKPFIEWIKLK